MIQMLPGLGAIDNNIGIKEIVKEIPGDEDSQRIHTHPYHGSSHNSNNLLVSHILFLYDVHEDGDEGKRNS